MRIAIDVTVGFLEARMVRDGRLVGKSFREII